MATDPNLPSAKRAAAFEWMVAQPAEIQKAIIQNLSFREQVHVATESANKYRDWTALLLVNEIHTDRIYTKFSGSNPNVAISDVIFSQPEFQNDMIHSNLNSRTATELKDLATHTRDRNMGVDRPSAAAKQALGLPQDNSETWTVLLQRDQNDNNGVRSIEFSALRRDEEMARYLNSSRPRCLLDVFSDFIGLRRNFTAAPNGIFCSSCLMGKFLTPEPYYIYPGAGRICKDCLGPELERQHIPLTQLRRFMAENEFNKYTLIHRESASAVTQHRFGRSFDDVMYMLDNGREP